MSLLYWATTVILVELVFCAKLSHSFWTIKFFFLLGLSVLGGLSFTLGILKRRKIEFAPGKIPFLSFFLILCILVSAWQSNVPLLSQTKTFEYLLWFAFLLLVWLSKASLREISLSLTLLEASGVPLAFYGIIQHFKLDPFQWYPGGTRIFSTLENADAFATFIAILVALSCARFIFQPKASRLSLILFELVSLYWSYTRSPILALCIASIAAFVLMTSSKPYRRFIPRYGILLFSMVITFLVLYAFSFATQDGRRMNPAGWNKDRDVIGRKYLFKKGFELFSLRPWTGVGPGNFSFSYLLLRYDDPPFYRTRMAIAESTHNSFLDLFVETGVFGGIAFLLLWLLPLRELFHEIIKGDTFEEENLSFVLFFPILVAFISLQFIYPDIATESLCAYLLGATVFLFPKKRVELNISPFWAVFFLVAASFLAFAGITYGVRMVVGDWFAEKGSQEMHSEHWAPAAADYERASQWFPFDPLYYQQLGKLYEILRNPRKALLNYNQVVSINDKNPYLWADIGRMAGTFHWRERALTAYARATQLDPYDPILHHDACISALSFGASPLALLYAREAYQLNPNTASNSYDLVLSLYETGKKQEASLFLNRELKRFPSDAGLQNLRAMLNKK